MSHALLFYRMTRSLGVMMLAAAFLVPNPVYAKDKTHIAYIPGITLAPEVLLADGQTPRSYNTSNGPALWSQGLPIQQGDKLKLDIFVATGAAELSQVIVRLDNTQIAQMQSSPWNDIIDTASMSSGYHMVDVWAQSTGNPPQSSDKQMTFYVVKQLPPQYAVKGMDQVYQNGQVSTVTPEAAETVPTLPVSLQGKDVDPNADVALDFKPASQPITSTGQPLGASAITVNTPMLFGVHQAQGSDASQFVYALTRENETILESDTPISLVNPNQQTVIKIQKRTDTTPGLRSGAVTLWVWGVDKQGQPGNPIKAMLQIP